MDSPSLRSDEQRQKRAAAHRSTLRQVRNAVLFGFVCLAAAAWMLELTDPPFSWREPLMENLLTVLVGAIVYQYVRRLLRRVRYLEGFLPVCGFCKRIRLDEDWVTLEEYMHAHSSVRMSHSVCPHCALERYGHEVEEPPTQ
jgi:hypothetical protein